MTGGRESLLSETVEPGNAHHVARELTSRFAAVHGREPDGVFSAPGRVNLMGEHTDYNQGLCLPIALPYATYVAVGARADDVLTLTSFQQEASFRAPLGGLGPGEVTGWPAYAAGVVWAAREAGIAVAGMDVLIHGTVPLGAGLSSSASLECAVALAVCALAGLSLDVDLRRRLVEVCGRAEREVAGAPTGGMDQTISLLAKPGHALLLDCRNWSTEYVAWEPSSSGVELLVVDTRSTHALTDGGYGSRRDECDRAAQVLGLESLRDAGHDPVAWALLDAQQRRRTRHVTSEIERVGTAVKAIARADFSGLGDVFDASHASLRDDFQVSCPELDAVCAAAGRAGALGARMTGGGFGGSAIALVPVDRVDAVRTQIRATFAANGWRRPGFLSGAPSDGARRVELGGTP